MTIPNMVPTVHTRLLAARLIEACANVPTPPAPTPCINTCFAGTKGQEVALVAAILDHKTGTPVALRPDWNDDGSRPNLAVGTPGGIDAAATAYGATPEQILRGGRPNIDVPARRVAMTVAHLAGGGYSEIGRFFNKDHSTVVTGSSGVWRPQPRTRSPAGPRRVARREDRDSDSAEMEGKLWHFFCS